jgi:hypothetical protein
LGARVGRVGRYYLRGKMWKEKTRKREESERKREEEET